MMRLLTGTICPKDLAQRRVRDMKEITVSGNIVAKPNRFSCGKEEYIIRNPVTSQGWGLPVENIEAEDLRVLADRLDKIRGEKS